MEKSSGKILIVDDEAALLRMMSVYLSRLGYSVATASSAEEARSISEAAPGEYCLAVVDATMEGVTLAELIADLLRSQPALRVIAASGYLVDAAQFEAAGVRAVFLQKPFTPEMLASEVRRMFAEEEEDV